MKPSVLYVASASLFLLGACASSNPQPPSFAAAPELRDCEGPVLEKYEEKDKLEIIVRVKDKTPRSYSTSAICVRIDGKLVPPTPADSPIERLRSGIGFVAHVKPGEHKVKVDAKVVGIGALEGHRFDVTADHDVAGGGHPLLDVQLQATGDPDVPPEKRLVLKWDEHDYKGASPP